MFSANSFYIDSPIYLELKRILNTSPLDDKTQLKIEKFWNNQGSLFLEEQKSKVLDINYHKINPQLLDVLNISVETLELFLTNYRYNVKIGVREN